MVFSAASRQALALCVVCMVLCAVPTQAQTPEWEDFLDAIVASQESPTPPAGLWPAGKCNNIFSGSTRSRAKPSFWGEASWPDWPWPYACAEMCSPEEFAANCDSRASCYKSRNVNEPELVLQCTCPAGMYGKAFKNEAEECGVTSVAGQQTEMRACCPGSHAITIVARLGDEAKKNGQTLANVAAPQTKFKAWSGDGVPGKVPLALAGLFSENFKPAVAFAASTLHVVDTDRQVVTMSFHFKDKTAADAAAIQFKNNVHTLRGKTGPQKVLESGSYSTLSANDRSSTDYAETLQAGEGSVVFSEGSATDSRSGVFRAFAAGCQSSATPVAGCPNVGFEFSFADVSSWAVPYTLEMPDFPQTIPPSGMEILDVSFRRKCLSAGCWKIDVQYTIGERDVGGGLKFNTFYIPRTDHPGPRLSYDYDYDGVNATYADWRVSEGSTFVQNNFPCGTLRSDALDATNTENPGGLFTINTQSACCLHPFVDLYRPVKGFADMVRNTAVVSDYDLYCGNSSTFDENGTRPVFGGFTFVDPPSEGKLLPPWQLVFPENYIGEAVSNDKSVFDGLTWSWVEYRGQINEYFGMHRATIWLDEIEMRAQAGKLTGTIGFEYTVETFVGLANFVPRSSIDVLEASPAQRNITLTKTDFFFVATHGENDYTFLSYVNLRLVEIYDARDIDTDFDDGTGEATRTDQISSDGAANYLQVTFVVDSTSYEPFETPAAGGGFQVGSFDTGLIPMTSVRLGQGDFIEDVTMTYNCIEFLEASNEIAPSAINGGNWDKNGTDDFLAMVRDQDCGPGQVQFCQNPSAIPDQFVSFNIPIGIDGHDSAPDGIDAAAADLSSNVFVEMVVQVQLVAAERTNDASDKTEQIKTTLRAGIPIVDGGVNIFCDALVAKTDLEDVVDVHVVVGSAASTDELSRLSIHRDIGSSTLETKDSKRIDSDSIEAGLMTLIIDGEESYFGTASQSLSNTYQVELEDLITIHIMEPAAGFTGGTAAAVLALINADADDNVDATSDLITDGYALNGAFIFEINRAHRQARLQPTQALLDLCSWRATAARPTAGAMFPTTCVMRRDVDARSLDDSVLELTPSTTGAASTFMQGILGANTYASNLGSTYAGLVMSEFGVTADTARYKRAFFINPGYEWSPTQTGGQPIFTVSQKLVLMALIQLNEDPGSGRRGGRRAVLQSNGPKVGQQESFTAEQFETGSSRKTVAAHFADIPADLRDDKIKEVTVGVTLTETEACSSDTSWARDKLRKIVEDSGASRLKDVLIMSVDVNKGDVACARRQLGRKLLSSAEAVIDAIVVFSLAEDTAFDTEALKKVEGVTSVTADSSSIDSGSGSSPKGDTEEGSDDEDDSSSFPVGIVAGVVGGVVGVGLLAAGGYFLSKRGGSAMPEVQQATTTNHNDLKSQLMDDDLGPVAASKPANGVGKVEAIF